MSSQKSTYPRSTAVCVKRFESAIENAPPKTTVSYALFWQVNILILKALLKR